MAPDKWPSIQCRTLSQIKADYANFQENGSLIKDANQFNNCVRQPYFDIPLCRVVLPVLHISLGIFHKFFKVQQSACQLLDIKIFTFLVKLDDVDEPVLLSEQFEEYTKMVHQIVQLESEADTLKETADNLSCRVESVMLQDDSDDDSDDDDGGVSLNELRHMEETKAISYKQADDKSQQLPN
ncbi:uncharacterized protein LOC144448039 [Glandiceps talaboti]